MISSQKLRCPLLLCILFLLLVSEPSHAQWSEEGLLLTNLGIGWIFFEPDDSAGVWILYEDYILGNPRPKIQHVDASGNKLFGPEGMFVLDDTLTLGWIYGIQPIPDGGVIAVYEAWDGTDAVDPIYAQRFSYDGIKSFGEPGAQITYTDWDVYLGLSYTSNVCTDGADGAWVIYSKAYSHDLYLTGINGDGTRKEDWTHPITTVDSFEGSLCADGNGGGYVVLQVPIGINTATYYNHFNADGDFSLMGDGGRVFDGVVGTFASLRIVPDEECGAVIEAKYDGVVRFQKIAADLSLPWGEDGYYCHAGQMRTSRPPSIRRDGSIVFASVDDGVYDSKVRFGMLSADGVDLVSYPDNVIESGDYDVSYQSPLVVLTSSGGEEYPLVFIERNRGDSKVDYYFTIHKMSEDGKSDLWADDPQEIAGGHLGYQNDRKFLRTLSDGTLFFGKGSSPSTGYMKYYLYKLDPNGHLTGVSGSGSSKFLPDRIEIVSAWPNPFNSSVTLTLKLPSKNKYSIEIYDINGRRIEQLGPDSSGSDVVSILWTPESTLPSGIYFIRARQGNVTSKVVKTVLLR